jgi:hypothetical protein
MNRSPDHPTDDQLQEFIDNRERLPGIKEHLDSCPECREIFRVMNRMDGALKTLPPVSTGAEFTQSVMSRIGSGRSSPFLFRFFGSIAHLAGLVVVLGVMAATFLFTGVINRGQVEQGQTVVGEYMQQVGGTVGGAMTTFNGMLRKLFPFAFGSESGVIWLLVVIVVIVLALADRVVGRRFNSEF